MEVSAPEKPMPRTARPLLWYAALGGPVAWALRLVLAYPLVPYACQQQSQLSLVILSALMFALSLGSAAVGYWALRREPEGGGFLPEAVHHRSTLMSKAGIILGILFAFAIAAESTALVGDPCLDVDLSPRVMEHGTGWRLLIGQYPNTAHADPRNDLATPDEAMQTWSWDPFMLTAIGVAVAGYLRGVRRAWRAAGRQRIIHKRQIGSFAAGVFVVIIALFSPVDTLGSFLFAAHMLQHLLLTLIAAPLLAFSLPALGWIWALGGNSNGPVRGVIVRSLFYLSGRPALVLGAHFAALWIWHLPSMYEAALASEWIHAFEHLCFFGTALLFWELIRRCGQSGRDGGFGILYLFAAAMQGGMLGILVALSPSAWYPTHATFAAAFSLSALEDQQLAGLLMWIPGGVLYLAFALWLAARWLNASERGARAAASPSSSTAMRLSSVSEG